MSILTVGRVQNSPSHHQVIEQSTAPPRCKPLPHYDWLCFMWVGVCKHARRF